MTTKDLTKCSKEEICRKVKKMSEKIKALNIKINALETAKQEYTQTQLGMSARIESLERRLASFEHSPATRDINNNYEQRITELEIQQRGLFDKIKKGFQKCKQAVQTVVDKAKENPLIQQGYALAKANIPQLQQVENLAHKAGIRDLADDFPEYANRSIYLKPRIHSGVSYYKRRALDDSVIDMNSFTPDADDLMNTPDPDRARKEAEMNAIKRNLQALNRALHFDPTSERGLGDLWNKVKEMAGEAVDKAKEIGNQIKDECKEFYYTAKNQILNRDLETANHPDPVLIENIKVQLKPVLDEEMEKKISLLKEQIVALLRKMPKPEPIAYTPPSYAPYPYPPTYSSYGRPY